MTAKNKRATDCKSGVNDFYSDVLIMEPGMMFAHKVIENMEGFITIDSYMFKGTEIKISLPCIQN